MEDEDHKQAQFWRELPACILLLYLVVFLYCLVYSVNVLEVAAAQTGALEFLFEFAFSKDTSLCLEADRKNAWTLPCLNDQGSDKRQAVMYLMFPQCLQLMS